MTLVDFTSNGEMVSVNADRVLLVTPGTKVVNIRGPVRIHFSSDHAIEVDGTFQEVIDKLLQHD